MQITKIITAKRLQGTKNGNNYDFIAYEGLDENNQKVSYRLCKTAEERPLEEGVYACFIEEADINKDLNSNYRQYWIKKFASFHKIKDA